MRSRPFFFAMEIETCIDISALLRLLRIFWAVTIILLNSIAN